jgi:hypothetical protein
MNRKSRWARKKCIKQVDGYGIDERKFASLVEDVIHREGEPVRIEYEADSFSLIGPGGMTFPLIDLYRAYQAASPSRRRDLLQQVARAWLSATKPPPQVFDDARANLFPVVLRRSTHECDLLELQVADGPGDLSRVFATHLAVGVVFTKPDSIMQLTEKALSGWGLSLDDSLEVAYVNLRNHSRDGLAERNPGYWVGTWDDNLDSSRILLPEVIERCKVKGLHVAMCPRMDALIVTGSEDVEGLEMMASQAEWFARGHRFLSGHAVLVAGGRCTPFELPREHPLQRRFQSLAHLTMACDYSRQGDLLAASYAGKGEDPFIARVCFTEYSDFATYSTWMAGVDALLPKAQAINFTRIASGSNSAEILAIADWDRVKEIVGDLMEPLGLYPERYRVRSFPTQEQLEEIRNSEPNLNDLLLRKASA